MSTTQLLPEFSYIDGLVCPKGPQTGIGGTRHSWCLIMTPFSVNDFCELLAQMQVECTSRAQAVRYLQSPSLYLEYDHGRRFGLYNFWDLTRATIEAASGDLAEFEANELDDALETIAGFVEERDHLFQPDMRSHVRELLLQEKGLEQVVGVHNANDTAFIALCLEAYAKCVSVYGILDAKLSKILPKLIHDNSEDCR